MESNKKYKELIEQNVGRKIFLRKKKNKDYTIAGHIDEVFEESFILKSEEDSYIINFEEIYSADIKSKG